MPLTTLVSVSRMYASFDVDEQTFLKYVNPSRTTGTEVPVQLGLANEDGYSREGQVQYVDNRLDTASGTIRVRAVFDNRDGSLVPGLYARVRLGGGAPREAVLVDEKAIGTDQNKRYVLVLDDQNHAAYREVTLGPTWALARGREGPGSGRTHRGQRVATGAPGRRGRPNIVSMDTAPQAVKTASAALQ